MKIPVLMETDCVMIGGTTVALRRAFQKRSEGKKVLIAADRTYLADDICRTNRYKVSAERLTQLPGEVVVGDRLHPDAFKKYLERMCCQNGIELLYFVHEIDCIRQGDGFLLRFASKGGMVGILCKEVVRAGRKKTEADLFYNALIGRDDDSHYEILTVRNAGRPENSIQQNLFLCQTAVLEAFAERKKGDPGLRLGRFAERGYDPSAGPGEELEKASQKHSVKKAISFQTANGFETFHKYPLITCPDTVEMAEYRHGIVIAGGGTAGVMAAIGAARQGLDTVLLEPNDALGGTATAGGVSTYWFGRRFLDVREVDGEIRRIYETLHLKRGAGIWSGDDDFHPGIRSYVYQKLCREAGVTVVFGQLAYGVIRKNGKVCGVVTAGEEGNAAYYGKVVVDATGDGDLAAMAGAETVYGSERDCITLWGSLAQYTSLDGYKNNFSSMLVEAYPTDYTRFILLGRKRGGSLFDHGSYVSMRESRHVRGMRRITLQDLVRRETYEDGLYTCYSNYDPKGKIDADMVYGGFLPPQTAVQIPLAALLAADSEGKRIEGLYTAGKAIDATHNVFPSIRMQPDLMHQGYVLGSLLGYALQKNCRPEDLDKKERRDFLLKLTDDPLTLPERRSRPDAMLPGIGRETRTHWVDVPFQYEEAGGVEGLALLLRKPEEVIDAIRRRMKTEKDPAVRDILTRYALWHGCDEWTEEYCDRISNEMEQYSAGQGNQAALPVRGGSVNCVQLLPDHGVMPEMVYRLNLLAWSGGDCIRAPFEKVLKNLKGMQRDYHCVEKGIFHYIEAFAYVAERSGNAGFRSMIMEILQFPEFSNVFEKKEQDGLLTERWQILMLILYRALARLGEKDGYDGLAGLLDRAEPAISCSACMELRQLTGKQVGLSTDQWKIEIMRDRTIGKVKRITEKIW